MATHDKEPIVDRFETVASPAAANEAVSKSKQEEDDGIVIATPSESWVLLDSKSDEEEVTLDYEASTAPRRQPGLIVAAVACALVVAAAGAFAATRPFAVVEPPPPPPPIAKRFVLASALDSVAAAAAKVRADGIDAQFELATGLDGSLASAAAVRLEALAKLSVTRCVEIKFQGAPDSLMHSTQAARLGRQDLDELDHGLEIRREVDRVDVGVEFLCRHFVFLFFTAGAAFNAESFAVRGCVYPKGRVLSITVLAGWQMAVKSAHGGQNPFC